MSTLTSPPQGSIPVPSAPVVDEAALAELTAVGEAVGPLSDYFKHITTISAGAITILAAFAGDLNNAGDEGWWAVGALACLAVCVLASTAMMWAYGVARREVAMKALASSSATWAFEASRRPRLGSFVVTWGSFVAPVTFVLGFVLLGIYTYLLLRP